MTDGHAIEIVPVHPLAPLSGRSSPLRAVVVGLVAGFALNALAETAYPPASSFVVPGAVLAATASLGVGIAVARSTTVAFREDAFAMRTDVPWLRDEATIPYDDVEVVVARATLGDRLLGTASYELVRTDGDDVAMSGVADPESFERAIGARVDDPREQYRRADGGSIAFWALWPDDREGDLPSGPVVEAGELEERLGIDLDDVDLRALDEAAAADDLEDFEDVAAAVEDYGDVTAAVEGGDDEGTGDASGGPDGAGGLDGSGGDLDGAGGLGGGGLDGGGDV